MAFFRLPSRRLGSTLTMLAAAFGLAACADRGGEVIAPAIPDEANIPPSIRAAAFVFDVDRTKGKVTVIAPNGASVERSLSGDIRPNLSLRGGNGKNYSILAGDVIELTTSNYTSSDLGVNGAPDGRIFVSFDVSIFNRLGGIRLIRPTFPAPPSGLGAAQQVLMFPFAASTVVTTGGTSTGGDGTEIIVEQPSRGAVNAALSGLIDGRDAWDGDFHNFFDDTLSASCAAGANPNCFLWEAFPAIQPNEQTITRRVGFEIDPQVNRFRARLLIAADLENAVAQFGTIAGNVSSPVLGPLAGVTVSATTGGFSATTDAAGNFSIANVPVGARTLQITSALPAGCSSTAQATSVSNGGTSTVNFVVTGCVQPTGIVNGSITSTGNPGQNLAGFGVILTPDGGSALPAVLTNAAGAFSATVTTPLSGATTGRITGFTNVPVNCTAPALGAGLFTYSVSNGGTVSISGTPSFTCTAPPILYGFDTFVRPSQRAGAPANEVELVFTIDMTPNRPDISGASPDELEAIQIDIGYGNTGLSAIASPAGTASTVDGSSNLDTRVYNPNLVAGTTARLIFTTTTGTGVTGATQVLGVARFTLNAGQTIGTITLPTVAITDAISGDGANPSLVPQANFWNVTVRR